MRILILALLTLLVTPAIAQDWGHYANGRFAYSIDIPPDYLGQGESANGDGQEFQRLRGAQRLLVWGGLLGVTSDTFAAEVKAQMDAATAGRWNIRDQSITPEWASFSAIKNNRVLYQRMILLCDRASYASFSAQYSTRDLAAMDDVVSHLVASLRATGC